MTKEQLTLASTRIVGNRSGKDGHKPKFPKRSYCERAPPSKKCIGGSNTLGIASSYVGATIKLQVVPFESLHK